MQVLDVYHLINSMGLVQTEDPPRYVQRILEHEVINNETRCPTEETKVKSGM